MLIVQKFGHPVSLICRMWGQINQIHAKETFMGLLKNFNLCCVTLIICHWYRKLYNASGEISLSELRSYPLTALTAGEVSSPYSERVSIVSCNHHVST